MMSVQELQGAQSSSLSSSSSQEVVQPVAPSEEMDTSSIISILGKKILQYDALVSDMATKLSQANLAEKQLRFDLEDEQKRHAETYMILSQLIEKEKFEKDLALKELCWYKEQETSLPASNAEEGTDQYQMGFTAVPPDDRGEIDQIRNAIEQHVQEKKPTKDRHQEIYEEKIKKLEEENNQLRQQNSQLMLEKRPLCNCKMSTDEIELTKVDLQRLQALVDMTEGNCCELRCKLEYNKQENMAVQVTDEDPKFVTTLDPPKPVVRQDTYPFISNTVDFSRWEETKDDYFYYTIQPPPQLFPDHPRAQINKQIRRHSKKSLKCTRSGKEDNGMKMEKQPVKATKSCPLGMG
ncbi:uncharacterized protein [Amphiura filiformis]|uniref:uncharacterized protein n=1 Tax=Amphiura filiformis TaxID=82378 RepID=UPI003B21B730